MAKEFNVANFKTEVVDSEIPVLIDFWATWCGPCRMIAPIIEQLATEYDGKVKVGKVDVDENPSLAQQFGIVSIPTIMVVKNGEVVKKQAGAMPKGALVRLLESVL